MTGEKLRLLVYSLLLLLGLDAQGGEVPFESPSTVVSSPNGFDILLITSLNGTGKPNYVTASATDGTLTWNNGFSTFTLANDVFGITGIAVVDLDKDGDDDLVGTIGADNTVVWWENDGTGGPWTEATVALSFSGASCVAVADLNRDGNPDIIAGAATSGDVTWFENDGAAGTWTPHTIATGQFGIASLAIDDFDCNGTLDVAGAAFTNDTVTWWANDGTGGGWIATSVAVAFDGVSSIVAVDINRDSAPDILGAASNDGDITWWENDGAGGTWTWHDIDTNFVGAVSASAVDIDFDGDLDVAGASSGSGSVSWWENTDGAGTTWTKYTLSGTAAGYTAIVAADSDGDADADIVATATDAQGLVFWENVTAHYMASYPETTIIDQPDALRTVYTADLDRDGDLDAVVRSRHGIAWYENAAGDGSTWIERFIDDPITTSGHIALADINRDGQIDVVSAEGDIVSWWENDGTPQDGVGGDGNSWTQHTIGDAGASPLSFDAVDMDLDGDLDVLTGVYQDEIHWWENTSGDGSTWSQFVVTTNFGFGVRVIAVDLDEDGDYDLAGVGSGTGSRARWHENLDGVGSSWSSQKTIRNLSANDNPTYIIAVDYDFDGDKDLLFPLHGGDEMYWAENRLPSSWLEDNINSSVDGPRKAEAVDVDLDGDFDLVVALSGGLSDQPLGWWESRGASYTYTRHDIIPVNVLDGDHAWPADLNGDGFPDILGAHSNWNKLTTTMNVPGQFEVTTTDDSPSSIREFELLPILSFAVRIASDGESGNTELTAIEVLFEETASDPLSTSEANALIESVRVYLYRGFGGHDPLQDTLVANVDTLSLTSGVQNISFTPGDPDVTLFTGTARPYYIAVQLRADASSQTPSSFIATHLTESSPSASYLNFNIDLVPLGTPDVSTQTISAAPGSTPDVPTIILEPAWTSGTSNIIQWNAVTYVESYTIEWDDNEFFTSPESMTVPVGQLSAFIENLTAGTNYWYRVRANNPFGSSAWSTSTFTAQDDAPPASQVISPSGTTSDTSLTVEWTASDPESGVDFVEIFHTRDGGPVQSLGTIAAPTTSITFSTYFIGGNGVYTFYSVATDTVSNVEAATGTDVTLTVTGLPPAAGLAYVSDGTNILKVDLATGDRAILSGNGVGTGPALVGPAGIIVEDLDSLLVLNDVRDIGATPEILRIDRVSGNREMLSDSENAGQGVAWYAATHIAQGPSGNIYLTDHDVGLVSIDSVTGNRTNHGTPAKFNGGGILVDSSETIYAGWELGWRLLEVEINPTSISTFSAPDLLIGTGPYINVHTAVLDDDGSFIVPSGDGGIIRVDQSSGDRVEIAPAEPEIGPGPVIPQDIAPAHDGTLLVFEGYTTGLYRVEPTNGWYNLVSGGADRSLGSGTGFASSYSLIAVPDISEWSTDTDSDGLFDAEELLLGTSPHLADSDGDSLDDGDEINIHGTDPTNADTDGDGIDDGDEINVHGTDPANADTDGDGINDGTEVALLTDPNDDTDFPQSADVRVDFAYTGLELGTLSQPFNSLVEALVALSPGGTVRINGASSTTSISWQGTLSKAMRIEADPAGTVWIGE